jgi:hypothetical protein
VQRQRVDGALVAAHRLQVLPAAARRPHGDGAVGAARQHVAGRPARHGREQLQAGDGAVAGVHQEAQVLAAARVVQVDQVVGAARHQERARGGHALDGALVRRVGEPSRQLRDAAAGLRGRRGAREGGGGRRSARAVWRRGRGSVAAGDAAAPAGGADRVGLMPASESGACGGPAAARAAGDAGGRPMAETRRGAQRRGVIAQQEALVAACDDQHRSCCVARPAAAARGGAKLSKKWG